MSNDSKEAWEKIKEGARNVGEYAEKTAKDWKEKVDETAKILNEPGQSPKKKAAWKKIGMGVALIAVILILATMLSGPSLSCDDPEVKDSVAGLVKESIQKIANNVNELAMIFEDPSSSEMRNLLPQLKNMKVEIGDVKETSRNDQAKRCSCVGDATIRLGDLTDRQTVRYQVMQTEKGIYVELDPVSLFRQ